MSFYKQDRRHASLGKITHEHIAFELPLGMFLAE